MAEEKKKRKLTLKQELFCKLYATKREYFGNGLQAYAEAYDIDLSQRGGVGVAKSGAYENLTKPDILVRIRELMELGPLNDEFVDRELSKLIEQDAEFGPKLGAIREYNALKQRIIKKIEATHTLSDEVKELLKKEQDEIFGGPDKKGEEADKEEVQG